MKVTFSRPATVPLPAPPVQAAVPPAPRRRAAPPQTVLVAGVLVLLGLIAVALWLWTLLAEGACLGVVGCETVTLRAPARGRIVSIQVAIGDQVRSGDRLLVLESADQVAELARLRRERADNAALLTRLDAEMLAAVPVASVESLPVPPPVSDDAARAAELKALNAEAQAAADEARAREDAQERMALLVRLSAAPSDDADALARAARLARARSDTLAARLAALSAPPAATPATAVVPTQTKPAPAPDPRPAIRAHLAALDAAIAQSGPRVITATLDGTVLALPTPGSDVAADGMVAELAATRRLWIDVYLGASASGRAARARQARVRGLMQDLPLRAAAWQPRPVPEGLRVRLPEATAISQRLELPPTSLAIPGQVVEVLLR